jgi:hypothetical protein
MARRIIRQETIDGINYNVVEDSDITVYTGPSWLFAMFNNYTHPTKPWHKIIPVIDPNGKPIIGQSVLDDPTWDFLAENPITYNSESKAVRDWLEPIAYVFLEEIA